MNPLKIRVPTHGEMAAMRDPASSGRVGLSSSFRITGGARNVGFRRPPAPSEAAKLTKMAAGFAAALAERFPTDAALSDLARKLGIPPRGLAVAKDAVRDDGAAWRGYAAAALLSMAAGAAAPKPLPVPTAPKTRASGRSVDFAARFRRSAADRMRRATSAWRKGAEILSGGKADGKPDAAFPAAALRAGMKVEREHVRDARMRKEIAKDHLTEDPRYYVKLRRMEKAAAASHFQRVKAAVVPLTPEERRIVMARGAVWHHGPGGAASPAIRKSVLDGKTIYWCATHRAWRKAPTLAGALREFKFVDSTG